MNQRTLTVLFMASMVYEVLLKLSLMALPSMFDVPGVKMISFLLSFLFGIVVIAFGYSLFRQLKTIRPLGTVMKLILFTLGLSILFRIPQIRAGMDLAASRLTDYVLRLAISFLILVFFIMLYRNTGIHRRPLRNAIVISAVLLGVNTVLGFVRVGWFAYFMASGVDKEPTPLFLGMLMLLFLAIRAALINFAWQFSKVSQESPQGT